MIGDEASRAAEPQVERALSGDVVVAGRDHEAEAVRRQVEKTAGATGQRQASDSGREHDARRLPHVRAAEGGGAGDRQCSTPSSWLTPEMALAV